MAGTVQLIVTHRCLVAGQVVEVGGRVELAPAAALDAVDTGRLEFVHPADRVRCLEARRAQIAKLTRRAPDAAGPWQRLGQY